MQQSPSGSNANRTGPGGWQWRTLSRIGPTVTEDRSIDDALRDMMLAGVRALLVVREDAVTGLVTSYDIQGERPLQFLRSKAGVAQSAAEMKRPADVQDEMASISPSSSRSRTNTLEQCFGPLL
jgi:CBS-domain-containing membrane protein